MWWGSRHTREKLLAQPFPDDWDRYLTRNLAYFRKLSADEQARLRGIVRVMVAEKTWEGCHDLVVSDEMKVTISGQAGLTILGIDHSYFDRVPTILVYPSGFRIPPDQGLCDNSAVIGQAVYRGPVILAWDEILAQGRDPSLGENVVIHEFAHQLDQEKGYANGAPWLGRRNRYPRWSRVMGEEYARLQYRVAVGEPSLFTAYGASSPAEFFAVASEVFFERPGEMAAMHPALYGELAMLYRLDPAGWVG
jgi:MtfA peptidase